MFGREKVLEKERGYIDKNLSEASLAKTMSEQGGEELRTCTLDAIYIRRSNEEPNKEEGNGTKNRGQIKSDTEHYLSITISEQGIEEPRKRPPDINSKI